MTQSALRGKGTKIRIGDDVIGASPAPTFTEIAEVTQITGPGMSMDTSDVTSMDSGNWRDFIAILNDPGEVTFDINYIPSETTHNDSDSTSAGLIYLLDNQILRGFELGFTQESPEYKIQFDGFVTNFEPSAPVDDVLTASVTLRLTGAPSFDA